MASCDNCIYAAYTRAPFQSPRKASLAIVGEAPSVMEARSGRLFNSPGADMLRETLKKAGLPDGVVNSDVYYLNALNCCPPRNKDKKKGISKEAITKCRCRVVEELKVVSPKIIILLGNSALQCVMGDNSLKITERQGSVMDHPDFPGVKIIAVVHPSSLMHSPGNYKVFSQILTYIGQLFNGTKEVLNPGKTHWVVARTKENVEEVASNFKKLATLSKVKFYVGADIETTGLNPRVGKMLVIGIAYAKNKVVVFPPEVYPYMNMIWELDIDFIWHNGKFDTSWLRRRGQMARNDQDDMLLHYCTNEQSGTHDLEQLSQIFLGAEAYKETANAYIKSKAGLQSAPEEILFERVAVDADNTRQLYEVLAPKINGDENLNKLYHTLLIPASELLRIVERRGMLINPEQAYVLQEKYTIELNNMKSRIQEELAYYWNPDQYMRDTDHKTAPDKFNPSAPEQLAWLVFDKMKLKPPKRKKRSTDSDVLLSFSMESDPKAALIILRDMYPWMADILDYRGIRKELSTYVEGMLKVMDSECRVHGSFSLHITSTGRLSCKGPNLQNIPSIKKDVRKMFIAPEGYNIIEVDYKGAELRGLACLSGVGKLGEALIAGRDLHDELSIKFWGPNFSKAQRMQAKTVNFGVPYGRTAISVALELGISVHEAQALIDTWFILYPEAKAYLDWLVEEAMAGRPLVTPWGRYRRFGLITPDTKDHIANEARNFPVQSTCSDCLLMAAIRIAPRIKPYNAYIVDLVHDSLVTECPEDPMTTKIVCKIIAEEMINVPKNDLGWTVPFGVDMELGKNWAEIHNINDIVEYAGYESVIIPS